jgi:hypothetical protein
MSSMSILRPFQPAPPKRPSQRRGGLLGLLTLGAALAGVAASCGGVSEDRGGTDGATHWLAACADDADCGELSCHCGLCTRLCDDAAACSAFGDAAACAVIAGDGCTAEAPRACTAPCTGDDECRELRSGTECAAGQCAPRAGTPPPNGACAPMDAASDGTECGLIPGYTWDGQRCEAVVCNCTGAECGDLFPTHAACAQAYAECYAGVSRACTRPSDCTLTFSDCCGSCGSNGPDRVVAVRLGDVGDYSAGVCGGDATCPGCYAGISPTAGAICSAGRCEVVDTAPFATCANDADCQVRAKECCECNADVTYGGLVALSDAAGYVSELCGPDLACDGCAPVYPDDVSARCADGLCVLDPLLPPYDG